PLPLHANEHSLWLSYLDILATTQFPTLRAQSPQLLPIGLTIRISATHLCIDPLLGVIDCIASILLRANVRNLPSRPPLLHLNRPGKRLIQHMRIPDQVDR